MSKRRRYAKAFGIALLLYLAWAVMLTTLQRMIIFPRGMVRALPNAGEDHGRLVPGRRAASYR